MRLGALGWDGVFMDLIQGSWNVLWRDLVGILRSLVEILWGSCGDLDRPSKDPACIFKGSWRILQRILGDIEELLNDLD